MKLRLRNCLVKGCKIFLNFAGNFIQGLYMVSYFFENTDFKLKNKTKIKNWLRFVAESEIFTLGNISVIFCSDNYILDINQRFLQHDYFTDIITFDYSEGRKISGDLFISVDSVRENSIEYGTEFLDELHRVIVHGILHLIGYDDHTDDEIKVMRSKEDYYLSVFDLM